MKSSKRIIQAYRQTPWRKQIQLIGLFAASVAVLALIAAVYLDVTSRAATTGRAVQELQQTREDLEQEIENMETRLADLRSVDVMQERAEKLGFEPLSSGTITYLQVPGYESRTVASLAPNPGSQFASAFRLPTEYTQSLFDWFSSVLSNRIRR
jgi:cell division protein FtsL